MASSRGGFQKGDPSVLPPWLSNSRPTSNVPSVTLSLSPTAIPPPSPGSVPMIPQLVECCKELEEMQRAWTAHKKEAVWRLRRVELQLESEKASRKREKVEEIEAKICVLKEEEKAGLERIEAEYKEQLASLRRDAESKEQKLAEQWAAKHLRLTKFLDQMGCRSILSEPNSR